MNSRTKFRAEVKHDGLHKYRVIQGYDEYEVEQRATAQCAIWDEMWQKKLTNIKLIVTTFLPTKKPANPCQFYTTRSITSEF